MIDLAPLPLEDIPISSSDMRGSCFLSSLNVFMFFTQFFGFSSAAIHLLIILYPCQDRKHDIVGWAPLFITRIFGIVFGVLITFQESKYKFIITSLARLMKFSDPLFMESWVGRGLFEIFCGCLLRTCALAYPMPNCFYDLAATYTSFALVIIGIVNCLLGFLCIQEMREWSLNNIRKQKQALLQAKQLSKHKSELEELMKKVEEESI